jgi:hypothetical protein
VKALALVAVLGALRVATAFVFSSGLAALAVAVTSWPFTSTPDVPWIGTLFAFSATVAVVSLGSAAVSWSRLPSKDAVLRRHTHDGQRPMAETLLLTVLAFAAVLQLPALLNWWTEDRALLRALVGNWSDPLGLSLIPTVILFSLPALATVALVVFVATSVGTMLTPGRTRAAILIGGTILQVGVVLVEYLALGAIQDLGRAVVQALEGSPDAGGPQAADFFARHDRVARDVTARIAAIFVGYVVTLVISTYATRRASRVDGSGPESAVAHPEFYPAEPVAVAVISQASAVFDQSQYLLRVRNPLVAMVAPWYCSYDIQTIPPTARARFSFSWATGTLRREPSGPDVLHIKGAERGELFRRTYLVTEAATGSVLAKLMPYGSDWEIHDASGRLVSTVVRTAASFEREQYVMKLGADEVCRLTWVSVPPSATGEFDVEFLPTSGARLDRALPMALAPVLQRRARRGRHG